MFRNNQHILYCSKDLTIKFVKISLFISLFIYFIFNIMNDNSKISCPNCVHRGGCPYKQKMICPKCAHTGGCPYRQKISCPKCAHTGGCPLTKTIKYN